MVSDAAVTANAVTPVEVLSGSMCCLIIFDDIFLKLNSLVLTGNTN